MKNNNICLHRLSFKEEPQVNYSRKPEARKNAWDLYQPYSLIFKQIMRKGKY